MGRLRTSGLLVFIFSQTFLPHSSPLTPFGQGAFLGKRINRFRCFQIADVFEEKYHGLLNPSTSLITTRIYFVFRIPQELYLESDIDLSYVVICVSKYAPLIAISFLRLPFLCTALRIHSMSGSCNFSTTTGTTRERFVWRPFTLMAFHRLRALLTEIILILLERRGRGA